MRLQQIQEAEVNQLGIGLRELLLGSVFTMLLALVTGHVDAAQVAAYVIVGETDATHVQTDKDILFSIYYNNAAGGAVNVSISNGFQIYSPNGATWSGPVVGDDTLHGTIPRSNWDIAFAINVFHGASRDTVGIIGSRALAPGLAPGYIGSPYGIHIGKFDASDVGKSVCIDSAWFRPGGVWKWTGSGGVTVIPTWTGPKCYTIVAAPSITVSEVVGSTDASHVQTGRDIVFKLRYANDVPGSLNNSISNGYRIYSPDGATWSGPIAGDTLAGAIPSSNWDYGFVMNVFHGVSGDTVGILGIASAQPGLPAGFNGVPYGLHIGSFDAGDVGKTICIDSAFFRPGGTWEWASGYSTVYPTWGGPYCYTVTAPPGAEIAVSDVLGKVDATHVATGSGIQFNLRYSNLGAEAFNASIANGFQIYSPDGATWSGPLDLDSITGGIPFTNFDLGFSLGYHHGATRDTVGIQGARLYAPGLWPGFSGDSYKIYIGTFDAADIGKTICIDSSFCRPAITWKWAGSGGKTAYPSWSGPYCYVIEEGIQTLAGTNRNVCSADASVCLTYDQVSSSGITGVGKTTTGPPPPGGFRLASTISPTYYQLATTAGNSGNIRICLHYTDAQVLGDPSQLRVLHYVSTPTPHWVDITLPGYPDLVNKIVCGQTTSLSPFALMLPQCCRGTTGNVDGDAGDIVDISDLSAMVDYLFAGGSISSCADENDVDKSGSVDISDLSMLVDFLFNGGSLPSCP
jgi:hypothetical protein